MTSPTPLLFEPLESLLESADDGTSEAGYLQAYELGRRALAHGIPPAELVAGYHAALADRLDRAPSTEHVSIVRSAGLLFLELFSPYEMALRGYRDTNRRLREAAAVAKAATEELDAFSYSVSHDLRAPLRAIDGFSQVLLRDYYEQFDEHGRDRLTRIRAASQRLGVLIDDLLQLSRINRAELSFARVDLSALARAIAEELSEGEPERAVQFEITEHLVALGDPSLLRGVLQNLMQNAWKYTGRHATARIEVGSVDGGEEELIFFVRDDGAGFDMAYADKLFKPFQRIHPSTEFEGHGIGLATVQRAIHRHGGQVRAEATIEGGATFFVTLKSPASTEAVP